MRDRSVVVLPVTNQAWRVISWNKLRDSEKEPYCNSFRFNIRVTNWMAEMNTRSQVGCLAFYSTHSEHDMWMWYWQSKSTAELIYSRINYLGTLWCTYITLNYVEKLKIKWSVFYLWVRLMPIFCMMTTILFTMNSFTVLSNTFYIL